MLDDWELPEVDDDLVEDTQNRREQNRLEKEQRVMSGAVSRHAQQRGRKKSRAARPVDEPTAAPETTEAGTTEDDGELSPEAVAALSMEDREERWGFSLQELQSASKVISKLFQHPEMFAGDETLTDSRLHLFITRPGSVKKKNREVYKQVVREEKQMRRDRDNQAINQTAMKKERDDAAASILALVQDAQQDGKRLIMASQQKEKGQEEEDGTTPMSSASPTASPPPAQAAARHTDPEVTLETVAGPGDKVEEEDRDASSVPSTTTASPTTTSAPSRLHRARMCYVCKAKYHDLHHYYYSMCRSCGDFNFMKRNQKRDLTGKVVLLTGCRIKIGWEMALSLLRCGATLLGTTRFAHDAVARFSQEPDYDEWKHRLHLYSLDLRDLFMVERFCNMILEEWPTLFALCHNAAQTIQRLPSYTQRLREQEVHPTEQQKEHLARHESDSRWRSFFLENSSVKVGHSLQLEERPVHNVFELQQQQPPKEGEGGAQREDKTPMSTVAGFVNANEDATTRACSEGEKSGQLQQAGSTELFHNPAISATAAAAHAEAATGSTETERVAAAAHRALHGDVCPTETHHPEFSPDRLLTSKSETAPSTEEGGKEEEAAPKGAAAAAVVPLHYDRYDTLFEASDLRKMNSWTSQMADVQGGEAAEVMAINAMAPFIMTSRLRPALSRRTTPEEENENRFVINVSAMEGQFCRFKLTTHPHTNMAKAALNMMTRTSGADFAQDRIFMNAVDTGWITDETPIQKRTYRAEKDLLCPLDEVDAAARCLDLIYIDSTEHSKFWKDYHPALW